VRHTTSLFPVSDSPQQHEPVTRADRAQQTADLLAELAVTDDPERARELREQVVLLNRRVAEAVAHRYRNRGIPIDDLIQVAYEGLTKAVARFDPTMRNDLLTFAVPTIRGEIRRYFRDHGWMIRPTRRIQEIQTQAQETVRMLEQELGHPPTDEQVADRLGVEVEVYREAMTAHGCFQPTSLDLAVGPQGAPLMDAISDPAASLEASDARVMLAPVVRQLSERDRQILYLRFFEDLTQAEIGQVLGVTQMQVSRLLNRILGTLRTELQAA